MFCITGLIWVVFVVGFTERSSAVHWGSEVQTCLTALIYFLPAYGFYFLGFRFYISKVITILCTVMAAMNLIVLAGTVHWLLCIPAALLAVPLGIALSVLVWKTDWE